MRYDRLFTPIDVSLPCGPDLDEEGDDDFLNYTLSVDTRLPERFFDKVTGRPFDRGTLDFNAESKAINALLDRTRDLRLLALDSRFQALAGQIIGFCECLQGMGGLLSRYWEHVHPRGEGGDFTLRQNTVSAVSSLTNVIIPLQFATILQDRRLGSITLRHLAVANGSVQPIEGMANLSATDIADALGNPSNADAVARCHGALTAGLAALGEINTAFVDNADYDYLPDLDEVGDTLRKIKGLIEASVPGLAPAGERGETFDTDVSETSADVAPASGVAAPSVGAGAAPAQRAASAAPAVSIASQKAAMAALLAAERYFAIEENSSPALILVSQARQLLGKSLVVALQALVPDLADRALIRIDPDNGFQIGMYRMREVTDSVVAESGEETSEAEPVPSFVAQSRTEAAALLVGVESFLKGAEPSSPIPLLLESARGFLNKDFRSILKVLIPR